MEKTFLLSFHLFRCSFFHFLALDLRVLVAFLESFSILSMVLVVVDAATVEPHFQLIFWFSISAVSSDMVECSSKSDL